MDPNPHAISGDEAAFSSHPLLHDEMATNTELHWSRRFAHGMLDWMLGVRLTARELAMLRVMDTITDRPSWESSILDADLAEALRRELRVGEPLLSARAWAWCLEELRDKAAEFVRTGRVLVYDAGPRVSKSSVKGAEKLKKLVGDLAAQKDKSHRLHGEEVQLRNLVDPSLHPLVYGHTKILPRLAKPMSSISGIDSVMWLPCDVEFVGDEENGGIRARITSYINDLHPKAHRALYSVIEEIITASIEPWNDVLTPAVPPSTDVKHAPYSAWTIGPGRTPLAYEHTAKITGRCFHCRFNDNYDWRERPPEESKYRHHDHEYRNIRIQHDFKDKGLQVYVNIQSIELTPENPRYEGSPWALAGMYNEHIVAASMYFFDVVNIADTPRLYLRVPANFFQDSLDVDEGHIRFLTLYLVDPNYTLVSTSRVPPQSFDWWVQDVFPATFLASKGLPEELRCAVAEEACGSLFTEEQSAEFRERLLRERKRVMAELGRILYHFRFDFELEPV
ncbi:unnamed protein product [Parascedosporium putredinis]|uniref:Uncharacterized protein n=1 Tax=Parascedosporium putredinis TaxID=1442378 RepID=A0A9P1H4L3_9PEZI|nr:unnamed protein product [Parascedosporium putredinis]CAI7996857.1 unnamed protein product [Parascedosporium putredinis]